MKRILFCISDFRQGGIPRCLQSILMNIDISQYEIDLICLSQNGPYGGGKMPNCQVVREDYIVSQLMVHTKKITIDNFLHYLPAIFFKIIRTLLIRIAKKDLLLMRFDAIAKRCKSYDAVIAYAEGLPAQLVERIECKNKLVWIHNDYDWEGARGGASITDFSKFRRICCVSKSTEQSFVRHFPKLKHKTLTIYNLVNEQFIRNQAKEPVLDKLYDTSSFTIISVGRVCAQKNFEVIPHIASQMKSLRVAFMWYVLGGGPKDEVNIVQKNIEKENVSDCVKLLGEKSNPYKYIVKSDLFVLTSIYESYPTVINESSILGVPIVSNNIPSAYEMLQGDGKINGIICPINQMADTIIRLIQNPKEYYHLKESNTFNNQNESILNQLYSFFNETDSIK